VSRFEDDDWKKEQINSLGKGIEKEISNA